MEPLVSILKKTKFISTVVVLTLCLLIAYVSWSEYRAFMLRKTVDSLKAENQSNTEELDTLKASSSESATALNGLYSTLANVIDQEKMKNQTLEERLGLVSTAVGSLDKLSKSDPQLLKKYSKIYFLNENYTPVSLTNISTEYTFNKTNPYQVHTEVLYFLEKMIDDGRREDVDLLVISAYRSFTTQMSIKANNKIVYGAGTANQFSAEQGFSEHQLGTTIDFTTPKTGANFSKFEGTKEFEWLKNNAHKYGFVLSYPKGNAYYIYEPWHWRFVGIELSSQIYANEKYFIDFDQKVIDSYLIKMFDR